MTATGGIHIGEPKPPISPREAHKHSSKHREALEKSEVIGCFYCCRALKFSEIEEWTDKNQTAVCPRCGIDAIIGDASGIPITPTFLNMMHTEWFTKYRRPVSTIISGGELEVRTEEDGFQSVKKDTGATLVVNLDDDEKEPK